MDFSGLRRKNETEHKTQKIIKTKNLVIAFDYYSAKKCEALFAANEEFVILGERAIDAHDVRLKGPSTLRIANAESRTEAAELIPSIFYKDQKWRVFGGRSKSMELKPGEEYFSYPRLNTQLDEIESALIDQMNEKLEVKKIISIEARDAEMVITTGDETIYEVENLFWPMGLVSFVELLKNKHILTEEMLTLVGEFEGPTPLYIDFEVMTSTHKEKTLFFPVSMTHEQGHFIGEMKKINEKKSHFSFVHFLDPNEVNEEHICRLIKNLKRQIEKIFEVKKSAISEEVIALSPVGMAGSINDEVASKLCQQLTSLHLIGEQYIEKSIFADSCTSWQSGFRGCKSVDIAELSARKSVDKNDRESNTYN